MTFLFPGEPVPQGRPRFRVFGKGVSTYDPPKSAKWKKEIGKSAWAQMAKNGHEMIESGAIGIVVRFKLRRPASAKDRVFPEVKPDLDNLLKGLKDALNGIVWDDDKRVCEFVASKSYADRNDPGIHVEVNRL